MKMRLTLFPRTFFQELRNTVEVFFELLSETLFIPNKPLHVLQSVTTSFRQTPSFDTETMGSHQTAEKNFPCEGVKLKKTV